LGLALVKKIVNELNGRIVIHSNPATAKGTTVEVFLPRYDLKTGETASPFKLSRTGFSQPGIKVEDEISGHDKPFILLVEDNVSMLNFLCNKLKIKYNLYTAVNGPQALNKLDTISKLDLIICDVMMDIMDGFEFLNAIKKKGKFSFVPFIFLTAKNTRPAKEEGLKLGAIDYIEKPFLINELTQKIDAVLNMLSHQRSALVSQAYEMLNGKKIKLNYENFNLTNREKEIAALVTAGKTSNQIADSLYISDKTVAKHIQNIFQKVGVSNRVELISKFNNLLSED
jgi:DNA-binding NarL/FixJ family response regulator